MKQNYKVPLEINNLNEAITVKLKNNKDNALIKNKIKINNADQYTRQNNTVI